VSLRSGAGRITTTEECGQGPLADSSGMYIAITAACTTVDPQ